MNEVTMNLTLDELTTINCALVMRVVDEDSSQKERDAATALMKSIKEQMKAAKGGAE